MKNTLNKIKAIAVNSYKESIRDRILSVLVVFGLAMIIASLLAASISLGQDQKIIVDFGLSAIALFGLLIAVFSGANLVYKEIDKKTIYFIFAKPLNTWELVVGKFFGLAMTLLLIYIFFSAVFAALVWWQTGGFNWLLLQAIALNYYENLIIIALVLIFSSFAAPLASAVYTILLYIIGHSTDLLITLIEKAPNQTLKVIYQIAYYLFPNLEKYNVRNDVFFGSGLEAQQVAYVLAYGLIYILIAIILASVILKKREY